MSVITGQINIDNNFSKVADVKLKFVIFSDNDNFSCDKLFFWDILPSINTNTSFSVKVPLIARERLADVNAIKVSVELETRVRPTFNNNLTDLLEYQIYKAKFNETIILPFKDSSLKIIISSGDFILNASDIEQFVAKLILVHTHLSTFNEKRNVAHGGCPVNQFSVMTKNIKDGKWFFRFVHGLNSEPIPVNKDDLEIFDDHFGKKLVELWNGNLPIEKIFTLRQLLNITLSDTKQKSFVVADGAHISWSQATKDINRQLRFLITCQTNKDQKQPIDLIFVVSSPVLDSDELFLQVAAWSNTHRAFNFYQRNNKNEWWWLGNSWHALKDPTRGKGPFDGHVNVELEHIVKDAVSEWNTIRLDNATDQTSLNVNNVTEFMRQVIDNTTYNIIAIDKEYSTIMSQDILIIPSSFFINIDMINQLSDYIDPDLSPIKVNADMYLNSIKKYQVCLKDDDKVIEQGDGMFAFPVPEPAFEDTSLLSTLLNRRIMNKVEVPALLSPKFILCLLMTDFCNPLDSKCRFRLMKYIPDTAHYNNNTKSYDLVENIVKNIKSGAIKSSKDCVETVFLFYWNLTDEALKKNCKEIIEQYFANLQMNLQKQDGVDDLIQLANSRRRMFRRKPLSEFDLTFPTYNNIASDALSLEMTPQGTVRLTLNYTLSDLGKFSITSKNSYILDRFDPPAYLNDMNPDLQQEWSERVKTWTQNAIKGYPDDYTFDGLRLQYFDPTSTFTSEDAAEVDIVWTAFPNQVKKNSVTDKKRWETADSSRDVQDEYCEWSVLRDPKTGKITRVTFTCEGPEYWNLIAEKDPDKLLEMYKTIIGPAVKKEDLFGSNKKYNQKNKWNNNTNTGNIVHLIQQNNTLEAEIELGGGSSVVRVINGRVLTSEQELIKCGSYGSADRFSDPHIGATVNGFARQAADVTIRNPVAIYLNVLDTSAFDTPDKSDPDQYWKFVRGSDTHKLYVRAIYEVPAAKGFTVGDIKIGGKLIKYGAQIADFLTIRIPAVACRFGQRTVPALTGCRKPKAKSSLIAEKSRDFLNRSNLVMLNIDDKL
ncbi:2313_t:CDS:2 [Funneliformis geosporum]|uniref:13284_t:CDS:1 n=1 Tax=Funneliformis geosporum TaxID=1117311 RepID=A0A9W4WJ28_9GLOM|nr:13284_t:CDS:2 [Funneliformis geosporum]CAI2166186.1 2313_t:CDS:2 [Funneliformis geosporum]